MLNVKLNECVSWLRGHKLIDDAQVCELHCQGSEVHLDCLDGKIDVSFTSPPYFNLETYSSDEYASSKNYGDYGMWIREFVDPILRNTYAYLKVGGYAMINIKNLTTGKKQPLFDDFMNSFKSIDGFEYVETFEMKHQHKRTYLGKHATLGDNQDGYVGFKELVMAFKKAY